MIPGPKVQGTCLAAPSSASPADAVKTGKATIPHGQDGLLSPLHGPAEPADGSRHPLQARPRLPEGDALGVRDTGRETGGLRAPRQRAGATHRNRAMAAGRRRRYPMTRPRRQVGRHRQVFRIIPARTGCGLSALGIAVRRLASTRALSFPAPPQAVGRGSRGHGLRLTTSGFPSRRLRQRRE